MNKTTTNKEITKKSNKEQKNYNGIMENESNLRRNDSNMSIEMDKQSITLPSGEIENNQEPLNCFEDIPIGYLMDNKEYYERNTKKSDNEEDSIDRRKGSLSNGY